MTEEEKKARQQREEQERQRKLREAAAFNKRAMRQIQQTKITPAPALKYYKNSKYDQLQAEEDRAKKSIAAQNQAVLQNKLKKAQRGYDEALNAKRTSETQLALNIGLNGYANTLQNKDNDPSVNGIKTANSWLQTYNNQINSLTDQLNNYNKFINNDFKFTIDNLKPDKPKNNIKDTNLSSIFDNIDLDYYNQTGDEGYIKSAALDQAAAKYLTQQQLNNYSSLGSTEDRVKYLAIITSQNLKGQTDWDKNYYEELNKGSDIDNGLIGNLFNTFRRLDLSFSRWLDDSHWGAHKWSRLTGSGDQEGAYQVYKAQKQLIDYANQVTDEQVDQIIKDPNFSKQKRHQIIQASKDMAKEGSPYYNYFKDDKSHFNWSDDDWLRHGIKAILAANYSGDQNQAAQSLMNDIQNDIAEKWTTLDIAKSGCNQFWDNAAADVLGFLSLGEAVIRFGGSALTGDPETFGQALKNSYLADWANGVQTMGGYWNWHPIDHITSLVNGDASINGEQFKPRSWGDYVGYTLGFSQAAEMHHQDVERQKNGQVGYFNPDSQVYKVGEENDFFNGNLFGSLMDSFGQYGFTAATTLLSLGTSGIASGLTKRATAKILRGIESGASKEYLNAVINQAAKQGIKAANISEKAILGATTNKGRQQLVKEILDNATNAQQQAITTLARKEAMDAAHVAARQTFLKGQTIATGILGSSEGALEAVNTYDQSMIAFTQQAREEWLKRHSQNPLDDNLNHSLEGRITQDIIQNHEDDILTKMFENRSKDLMTSVRTGAYTEDERTLAIQQLVQERLNEEMSKDELFQNQILNANAHAMVAFETNFWANSMINGMLNQTLKLQSMSKTARETLNHRKGMLDRMTLTNNNGRVRLGINTQNASKWWNGFNQAAGITKKFFKNAGGEGLEEITQDVTNAASQAFANNFYTGYLAASYNPESRDVVNGGLIDAVYNGIRGGYLMSALGDGLTSGIEELGKQETWKDGLYGFMGAALGGPNISTHAVSQAAHAVKEGWKAKSFKTFGQTVVNDIKGEYRQGKKGFKDAKNFTEKLSSLINTFNNISPITMRNSLTQAINEQHEENSLLQTIVDNVNSVIDTDEAQELLTYLPTQVSFMQALDYVSNLGNESGTHDLKAMMATLNSLILNTVQGSAFAEGRNAMLNARISWKNILMFNDDGSLKQWDDLSGEEKQSVTQVILNQVNNIQGDTPINSEGLVQTQYEQAATAATATLREFKQKSDGISTQITDAQAIQRMSESAQQQLDFDKRVKELSDKYDNLYGDSPLDFESKAALISGDIMIEEWVRRRQDLQEKLDGFTQSLNGQETDDLEQTRNQIISQNGSVASFKSSIEKVQKKLQTQKVLFQNTTDTRKKAVIQAQIDQLEQTIKNGRALQDSIDMLEQRQQEASSALQKQQDRVNETQKKIEALNNSIAQHQGESGTKEAIKEREQLQKNLQQYKQELDRTRRQASESIDKTLDENDIMRLDAQSRNLMIQRRLDELERQKEDPDYVDKTYSAEQKAVIDSLIAKGNNYLNDQSDQFHQSRTAFQDALKDMISLDSNVSSTLRNREWVIANIDQFMNIGAALRRDERYRNVKVENAELLDSNNFSSFKEQEIAIRNRMAQYDKEAGIPANSREHSEKAQYLLRSALNQKDYQQYRRNKLNLYKMLFLAGQDKSVDFTNPNVLRAIAVLYELISKYKQGYSQARYTLDNFFSNGGNLKKNMLPEDIEKAINAILNSGDYIQYLRDNDLIPSGMKNADKISETLDKTYVEDSKSSITQNDKDKVLQEIQNLLGIADQKIQQEQTSQNQQEEKEQKDLRDTKTIPDDTESGTQGNQNERKQERNKINGDGLAGKTLESIALAELKQSYPNFIQWLNDNYEFEDYLFNYEYSQVQGNMLNGKDKFKVIKVNYGDKCFTLVVAYDPKSNERGNRNQRRFTIDKAKYSPIAVVGITNADPDITNSRKNFRECHDSTGHKYIVKTTFQGNSVENNQPEGTPNVAWTTDQYDQKKPLVWASLIHSIIHSFLPNLSKEKPANLPENVNFPFYWNNSGVTFEQNMQNLSFEGEPLMDFINKVIAGNRTIDSDLEKLPILSNIISVLKTNGDKIASLLPPSTEDEEHAGEFIQKLFTYTYGQTKDNYIKIVYADNDQFNDKVHLTYDRESHVFKLNIDDDVIELQRTSYDADMMLNIMQTLNKHNLLVIDNDNLKNQLRSNKLLGQNVNSDNYNAWVVAGYAAIGMIRTQKFNKVVKDRKTSTTFKGKDDSVNNPQKTTGNDTQQPTQDGHTTNPMEDSHNETPQHEASRKINTALKKARSIVDRIKQEGEKVKLRNKNAKYYEDEQGNKSNRVTSTERYIEGKEVPPFQKNAYKQATGIGDAFDSTQRWAYEWMMEHLTQTNDNQETRFYATASDIDAIDKYICEKLGIDSNNTGIQANMNKSQRLQLIRNAMAFYNKCVYDHWYIVPMDISVYGNVLSTSNRQFPVAGTLDLLVYDENGQFRIVDMKTFHVQQTTVTGDYKGYLEQRRTQWTVQLNLYKQLLSRFIDKDNWADDALYILPYAVQYNKVQPTDEVTTDDKTNQITITKHNNKLTGRPKAFGITNFAALSRSPATVKDLMMPITSEQDYLIDEEKVTKANEEDAKRPDSDFAQMIATNQSQSIEETHEEEHQDDGTPPLPTEHFNNIQEETQEEEQQEEEPEETQTNENDFEDESLDDLDSEDNLTNDDSDDNVPDVHIDNAFDRDDLVLSHEQTIFNEEARKLLKKVKITFRKSKNKGKKRISGKQHIASLIRQIVGNTLEQLSPEDRSVFDIVGIPLSKLIGNPQRFVGQFVSKLKDYYNSVLNTQQKQLQSIKHQQLQHELLWDVVHENLTQEQLEERLDNMKYVLSQFPLLMQYFMSDEQQKQSIIKEYKIQETQRDTIKNEYEQQRRDVETYYYRTRNLLDFINNRQAPITIMGVIQQTTQQVTDTVETSGIDDFSSYDTDWSYNKNQETGKEDVDGLIKQLFNSTDTGTVMDAVGLLKNMTLGDKPLVDKGNPLYDILYALRYTLQQNSSRLTVELQDMPYDTKGSTIVTGNNDVNELYIVINPNAIYDKDQLLHTIAHELIHAVTMLQVRADSQMQKDLRNVISQVRDYLNAIYMDNYETCNEIYGLKNVDDFIAEYFSNPLFQNMLKTIPYNDNQPTSAFKKVLNIVKKKLFKQSVYDKVTPMMQRLIHVATKMDTTARYDSEEYFQKRLMEVNEIVDGLNGRFYGLSFDVQREILKEMTIQQFEHFPRSIQDQIINCKTF